MYDLLLKNAQVVTPNGVKKLDIGISNGKIVGLTDPCSAPPAITEMDFSDKIILPGLIDSHSHLTFYGSMKEGTRTAASGGVTTVIEMPTSNILPYVMDAEVFKNRIISFNQIATTDYALFGGISPLNLSAANDLNDVGAAAFKVFLSYAGDYKYFTDYDLHELFKITSKFNGLVSIHAETETMCENYANNYRKKGYGAEKHSDSRPVISEVLAVGRLARLALETGARANVCHISAPQVVDELNIYRKMGAKVTAETCPHYLSLTQDDVERCKAFAKCQPPLREQDAVDGLWECVIAGGIDIIGSDHATYSAESKSSSDFWDAPGGFPGLDLMLPTLISEGVHKRGLSWTRLAEISSLNAAKAFGLDYCKGSIEIGKDADFAVVDPNAVWSFNAENSFYLNKSDKFPYEGRNFKGKVTETFVRGTLVYDNGRIVSSPIGNFVSAKHNA